VLPKLVLVAAIIVYATYFSYLTITRFAAYESRALDMGNLDQTVWNTAHGRWFHLTNQPGTVNRLSLHVEPILLPISWLYWLYSGPPTLLVLQAAVVALGAWPVFAIANQRLRHNWLALVFALAFLLNPTIQAANWLEFHPLTLAPTLLMAAFWALTTGRIGWYALFAVLAASCKEEIALLVFGMGLYGWLVLGRRRTGWVSMALALFWALLAVFVIQNRFAAGNIHWGRYAYLGENPVQIMQTLVTQSTIVLAQLQKAQALDYLLALWLPLGLFSLLAPELFLLTLPSLGINLLADFPPMHQVYELIYAAPILPFVLISAIYGAQRLRLCLGRWRHGDMMRTRLGNGLLALWVGGFALFAQWQHGYLPGSGNHRLYAVSEHHQRAANILAQIPPDAKVSAQDKLNPHVSGRETVYIFPRVEDADTIWVDVTGPAWPQHPNDLHATVLQLLADDFGVAAADDGYLLLRRSAPSDVIPASFYSAFRRPNYQPSGQAALWFGDQITLLGHNVTVDAHGELVVQLYWQLKSPLAEDLRFYVGYADATGNVLQETLFYPPVAILWYPTSQWPAGEPVLVQTLPWRLDVEQFALLVGVYRGQDGWQNGDRLPLTVAPTPTTPHFEGGALVRLGGYRRSSTGDWMPIQPNLGLSSESFDAQFGEGIFALTGVQVETSQAQPGEQLDFKLFWLAGAQRRPDFDYSVFAHLVDAQGNKVAQVDWQPRDAIGRRPMTSWLESERLVDPVTLDLPAELPPGDYRLLVGAYNWQSGERLSVTRQGAELSDVVVATVVRVE
jgi:uncharacterized membrane protein